MSTISRRRFLTTAAAATASAAGATLWLPRYARGTGQGRVRHVIVLYLFGGVRWLTSFGGADNLRQNPYGRLPWELVPEAYRQHADAPGRPWQPSRIFHLIPRARAQATFDEAYARLASVDAADFNFSAPALDRWPGAPPLPPFAALAPQVAVVHCDANPRGAGITDHVPAQQNLFTCSTAGTVGLGTLFNAALLGRTRLPAVAINAPGFAQGGGAYAAARPLALSSALALPTVDPGRDRPAWAPQLEGALDGLHGAGRQAYSAQALQNFLNDKRQGGEHSKVLVQDALRLGDSTQRPAGSARFMPLAPLDTAFGQTLDGAPVYNGMLRQVCGVSSSDVAAEDILNDAYRSLNQAPYDEGRAPGWINNAFGLNAALAVRLLQHGSAVVCMTLGNFDTHNNELLDNTRTAGAQMIQVSRALSGLAFALQNIQDPDGGGSLWDSTVIVACSEFGRHGGGIQPNGFNTGLGSDHDRAQYFPLTGGALHPAARGQLLSEGGAPFAMNSLWTALLAGMGAQSDYLPARAFPPIPGLIIT